jgi:hypothetical protein
LIGDAQHLDVAVGVTIGGLQSQSWAEDGVEAVDLLLTPAVGSIQGASKASLGVDFQAGAD